MNRNDAPCICGHPKEKHTGDPEYPGSTDCSAWMPGIFGRCDCMGYQADEPDEDNQDSHG